MGYNIKDVRKMFKEKDYSLLSETYKNQNEKLQFICNKHKDLGIQEVTLKSFLKNKDNCKECLRENRFKNWHSSRKFKPITREEFRQKHFSEYEQKLKNIVHDEYELIDVFKENNKTYIKILHNSCGKVSNIEQNRFFKRNQRCNNPSCISKKLSEIHTKTIAQLKKEIFNLVGDEYDLCGEYKGTNENMVFKHNIKSCGFEFKMTPHNFLSGQRCPYCAMKKRIEKLTKSQEFYENEIHEKFGNEFEILGKYINSKEKIKIKHNVCGHIFEITANNMLRIEENHCPYCNNPTKGEQRIINYLDLKNEEYIYQKRYKDLLGINNGILSYDFYIPKYNTLIEYQGNFHDGTASTQTEEQLEIQKEHDRRKRNYAKSHNIELLEIWYWDFDKIEDILDDAFMKNLVK